MPKLEKVSSGIHGLDEITGGGLPKGRPTLIYGSAGSGKTLMSIEFLIRGAILYNEPGVFISFEETEEELATNVSSLGFDLSGLIAAKKIFVDYVAVERSEIEETGEYDLEGLFVRLSSAINAVKAKRVVIDTIEVLFAGLNDKGIVRAELRRLFRWLKGKGVTTIVTGERGGETTLTRHGLEEYVSDCVIFLDNRVNDQLSTRRIRIIKYRGSSHSTNEFPFLIDEQGLSILPINTIRLNYPVSNEGVPSGVDRLDIMLGGKGFIKGTSILVSGMVGTGKTSLAAHLVDTACRRGQKCLYYAFEEAPDQIMRNMTSIGIDLKPWVEKGLLHFHATRVSEEGLEKHLLVMQKEAEKYRPDVVIVDALTDFISLGPGNEVRLMILRIVDYFKMHQITAMFSSMSARADLEETGVGLSSAFDTWIHLVNVQNNQERNRTMTIVKSRGMAHSNQVREFVLTNKGVKLVDIYATPAGSFMGTARIAQMAADQAAGVTREEGVTARERQLQQQRRALEAKIDALRAEFEAEAKESELTIAEEKAKIKAISDDRKMLDRQRKAEDKKAKTGV
ncbi:circadian clock protein KaiC [Dehalogenimonas etheniformans]|uniref:non-specific serine/threonine protein kinase n=2 Tax=Dehalogenimonas etheniformans TaxID=1536648 RepID=A0A2P5P530_9CHLR|nr:KaiC 1 [Dehalogenimonas etheniformans]QNT77192.1 circadian clock protein KaiC [Dehalogenimonas etheniformans]